MSLLFGALGVAAHADDPATPSSTSSSDPTDDPTTADSQPTDPSTDPSSTAPAQPSATGSSLTSAVIPPPVPAAHQLVLRRGLTDSVNVALTDSCGLGTCTYGPGSIPAGWGQSVTSEGVVTIWVPGATRPGRYTVHYTMTRDNDPAQSADGIVTVDVTPDAYSAPAGMLFSHPYRKGYRYKIQNQILRTINSVPTGARIQVASWSFSSPAYYKALNQAKQRGVLVQIVLSARNQGGNSDWRPLSQMFGTNVSPTSNWVKRCNYSCRGSGRGGTMHSKIFLFSQVYRTPYVMMTGSANLTDFAVTNQWNQMNTVSGDQAVYDEAVRIFTQMSADRLAHPEYVETHYPNLWTYYYPRGAATPANDFMLKALAPVRCTGAVNAGKGGRTIIKIAMYAWYQDRGKWLAKRVRQLWQQGCQVQIVYAISSNPVKKILYSPSGRGRIPMRQILLTNSRHTPIYYLHDKWVAITGNYAGVPNNSVSFQGSFNFANLGFYSDENFQMIRGRATFDRFARDFTLLWTDRQARAPSPVSVITNVERTAPASPTLGTGAYRYMEAD